MLYISMVTYRKHVHLMVPCYDPVSI